MNIAMNPIGYIQSPFKEKKEIPKQGLISEKCIRASIQLLDEYKVGVSDIEEGSYGIILFYFHESEGYSLKTLSHKTGKMRGLFSTRSPNRPNGIGLSIVKFTKIDGTTIEFQGVDMIDGTPVLDIKPYDEELNPKI